MARHNYNFISPESYSISGVYLGLKLKPDLPDDTVCSASECDGKLVFGDGTSFVYESWMGNRYDQNQNGGNCRWVGATHAEQTQCSHSGKALCESTCPGQYCSPPPHGDGLELNITPSAIYLHGDSGR